MLSSSGPSTEMYGVLLLLASLVLDGVCGPTQERVHREFPCSNLAFMFLVRASAKISCRLCQRHGRGVSSLLWGSKRP
jgi:hypothetical protein